MRKPKLVRVIKGSVIDVAVDLRKNSATFGQHFSLELNDKNNLMFYIPVGFAHGFIALEDQTIFVYKCSALYNKQSEGGIIWNDSTLVLIGATQSQLCPKKMQFYQHLIPKYLFFKHFLTIFAPVIKAGHYV
jgi:dTDP-4-dehydrorhamnose 3,5-epimerase